MRTSWILFREIASVITLCCLAGSPAQLAAQQEKRIPSIAFDAPDIVHWFTVAPVQIPLRVSPPDAIVTLTGATLREDRSARTWYAVIEVPERRNYTIIATVRSNGKTASDTLLVVMERPMLRFMKFDRSNGTEDWRGLRAVVGGPYDPSSEWNSPISEQDYQTIVTINGITVLDSTGTSFRKVSPELKRALTIAPGTRPEDIVTKVYWRPGGTSDRNQ